MSLRHFNFTESSATPADPVRVLPLDLSQAGRCSRESYLTGHYEDLPANPIAGRH